MVSASLRCMAPRRAPLPLVREARAEASLTLPCDATPRVPPTSGAVWHIAVGVRGPVWGRWVREAREVSASARNHFAAYLRGVRGVSVDVLERWRLAVRFGERAPLRRRGIRKTGVGARRGDFTPTESSPVSSLERPNRRTTLRLHRTPNHRPSSALPGQNPTRAHVSFVTDRDKSLEAATTGAVALMARIRTAAVTTTLPVTVTTPTEIQGCTAATRTAALGTSTAAFCCVAH